MGPITPNQTQRETQPAYFSVTVCVFLSRGGLSNKQDLHGDNRCSCSKEWSWVWAVRTHCVHVCVSTRKKQQQYGPSENRKHQQAMTSTNRLLREKKKGILEKGEKDDFIHSTKREMCNARNVMSLQLYKAKKPNKQKKTPTSLQSRKMHKQAVNCVNKAGKNCTFLCPGNPKLWHPCLKCQVLHRNMLSSLPHS